MEYLPADARYQSMSYNRVGRSGVRLPAVSLGLWHNFGDVDVSRTAATSRAARSISASRISTWLTTTARRRAPPRRTSARSCARISIRTATR